MPEIVSQNPRLSYVIPNDHLLLTLILCHGLPQYSRPLEFNLLNSHTHLGIFNYRESSYFQAA